MRVGSARPLVAQSSRLQIAEQVLHYRAVLTAFSGRKVVVRLLDAGADKPLPFLNPGNEQNPALGVRGLRALRRHEEILTMQLAALVDFDPRSARLWLPHGLARRLPPAAGQLLTRGPTA